jgi:hypothetical protein
MKKILILFAVFCSFDCLSQSPSIKDDFKMFYSHTGFYMMEDSRFLVIEKTDGKKDSLSLIIIDGDTGNKILFESRSASAIYHKIMFDESIGALVGSGNYMTSICFSYDEQYNRCLEVTFISKKR